MLESFRLTPARPLPDDPLSVVVQAQLLWYRWREASELQRCMVQAEQVMRLSALARDLTPAALAEQLQTKRSLAARGRLGQQREELLQALALLCEVCRRTLGIAPYQVQVVSVLAMYDGYIVQLAPGEGKTVTIGLLAALRGWSGKPCHVITANDYLAARDADELEPFYRACGVSVGKVLQAMSQDEKRTQYRLAVVYATVKQLLADHLTDQISFGGAVNRLSLSTRAVQGSPAESLLMRGLDVAIVDEADNVLVDEAITPMIISGPDEDAQMQQATLLAYQLCERLQPDPHYRLDTRHRDVKWTVEGEAQVAALAAELPPLWRGKARREDLMAKAVLARDFFAPDQHYVVLDNEVVIVDEGTGRPMPGRSWSYGLHQAVEARAQVPLTQPRKTLARLSFQNYFKLYRCLTGASGTLQNIGFELFFNYRTPVMRVPSRLPSRLTLHPLSAFPDRASKWQAVVQLVQQLQREGKPVLIGARTIEDSEALSVLLLQQGVEHLVLNAKKLDEEADVIAQAGRPGQVTVATNMAGRGTDIKLPPGVAEGGGLRVVVLEPHESARVDWQLYGRAGRQGQPGAVHPFLSRQDELFVKHLSAPFRLLWAALDGRFKTLPLAAWMTWLAQRRAQSRAFSMRRFMNDNTREHRKRMTFTRHE